MPHIIDTDICQQVQAGIDEALATVGANEPWLLRPTHVPVTVGNNRPSVLTAGLCSNNHYQDIETDLFVGREGQCRLIIVKAKDGGRVGPPVYLREVLREECEPGCTGRFESLGLAVGANVGRVALFGINGLETEELPLFVPEDFGYLANACIMAAKKDSENKTACQKPPEADVLLRAFAQI